MPSSLTSYLQRLFQSPSKRLAASIKARDWDACVKLLEHDSASLTRRGSAFEWLKDPLTIGLSSEEIVTLMFEQLDQGPWICYDPRFRSKDKLPEGHPNRYYTGPWTKEIKRKVAEFCGLGGIVPTSDNFHNWKADVIVWSHRRSAGIRFATTGRSDRQLLERSKNTINRFLQLYEWLQSLGRIKDDFVILRFGEQYQVRAVRIDLSHIHKLKSSIEQTLSTPGIETMYSHELRRASGTLLRLLLEIDPRGLESAHACAIAVQALCVAILSLSQAHLGELNPFFMEHSLSLISFYESQDAKFSAPICHFGLVALACAGDMVKSHVMVFSQRDLWSIESHLTPCNLVISPEEIRELWGPVTVVSYPNPEREEMSSRETLLGLATHDGLIYRPSERSSMMHWAATEPKDAPEQPSVPSIPLDDILNDTPMGPQMSWDMTKQITIGALDLTNSLCPTRPDLHGTVSRKNISRFIEELGTRPETWQLREKQIGIQGGQFLNGTINGTLIRYDPRSRKQKGLEQVDLNFLNKPWGLLVSVCTGIAQRVALREVIAEVMLPIVDASMEKSDEWRSLMTTGEGVLQELKKPTFPAWYGTLPLNEQSVLNRYIRRVLQVISWTGVNNAGKIVVSCPAFGDSDGCIHISGKGSRPFSCILKDTERSATFACLTNSCFTVDSRLQNCQKTPKPHWKNRISALSTSVCQYQYQWSGVNDWEKLSREDLKQGGLYWIGNSDDKRRVTAETHSPNLTKLMVSGSLMNWRFLCRAWERFERVRRVPCIELREKSLMTEDCARDVLIVRE